MTTTTATHTVRYIDASGVEQIAYFTGNREAWAFFKQCGAEGVLAGYPNWVKPS